MRAELSCLTEFISFTPCRLDNEAFLRIGDGEAILRFLAAESGKRKRLRALLALFHHVDDRTFVLAWRGIMEKAQRHLPDFLALGGLVDELDVSHAKGCGASYSRLANMSNKRCCIEDLILLQLLDLAQRHCWLSLDILPVRPIHDRVEFRPAQVHNQLERRVQVCLG